MWDLHGSIPMTCRFCENQPNEICSLLSWVKRRQKTRFFLAEKNCSTQKFHVAITLSKIRPDDPAKWAALMTNILKRRLPHRNGTLWAIGRILWKHVADFLKTNRRKFAVIWIKKGQRARFLSPRSSKIIVTEENERRKRKSEERERRRRKKAMVSFLVFIIATLKKNFSTQKVHLAITLSKIRLECCSRRRERTHDEIRLLTIRLFS